MKKLLLFPILLLSISVFAQLGGSTSGLGITDYGEMGNTVDATEVCQSADEWHGMFNANINASAPHLTQGFIFTAGKEGVIASVADNGSGDIRVTDVAHGLLTGDYITIQASVAAYTGIQTVTKITDDTFDCVGETYSATATGTWQMGSYLRVSHTGLLRGVWNCSFSQSLNNTQTSQITPVINTTISTKALASRLLTNNTDVGSVGGNGLMQFTSSDRIWFVCKSTSAQTLTFTTRNVSIH